MSACVLSGITAFIVLFNFISYGFGFTFCQLLPLFLAYQNGTPKISWNLKEEVIVFKSCEWAGHVTSLLLLIHIAWYK